MFDMKDSNREKRKIYDCGSKKLFDFKNVKFSDYLFIKEFINPIFLFISNLADIYKSILHQLKYLIYYNL